jgi:hypothetical protein
MSMLRKSAQIWALSLLSGLYLFRGMLEFPFTGWQPQTILTVVIGLGLLPALAGLATTNVLWRRPAIAGLCVLGFTINGVLLVLLWKGLTPIAALTLLIMLLYAAAAAAELRPI